MGLTTLPEVGTGEELGPVKVPRPLQLGDPNRDITTAEHNAAMAALEGVCAEVGLTDGSTAGSLVARVTAIEDAPPGAGDVVGPASAVSGSIASFDGVTGKLIEDSGVNVFTLEATANTALSPIVPTAHTAATKTLGSSDAGYIIHLDPTSNAIEVTIPHTLYDSGTGSAFRCTLSAENATNAITLVGSGGLVLTYYGDSTITAGDIIRISVESATVCRVEVVHAGALSGPSSGTDGALLIWDGAGGRLVADSGLLATDVVTGISDADTKATNALYPLVQSAHTAATKTLAAGDAGDIIPLSAASNAIEVTIPHTLFATGGTGRAWVCQCKAVSVAGGALTFVGSGGIVIEYYGKDPGTDAYIAGDWLTIVVDSATTASIFAVEAL